MKHLLLTIIQFCILAISTSPVHAKPLVADISSHNITIHSAFHGTQLMLFGARNDAGDVVVVVRGPARNAVVRKKEHVGGIWINRTTEKFNSIPGFYAIKSSRPFKDIMKSRYFDALGIGDEHAISPLILNQPVSNSSTLQRDTFRKALLQHLKNEALYDSDIGNVTFIEETLFKTNIPFPDKTPRGTYTAEIYLFSDGELVGSYTAPIEVVKIGMDAFLFESAHEHSAIYGIVAVLIAVSFGWLANELFRRV
jgi:uncharacterized protein (TIGR02186 family)